MSIISFRDYKKEIDRLLSDMTISKVEFDTVIEDLISQVSLEVKQLELTACQKQGHLCPCKPKVFFL